MRILSKVKRLIDPETQVLVKNSSWVFAANFVNASCMFIQSIILARLLGPATFGIYILILTVIDTVQEFVNLNIESAVVKYTSEFKVKRDYFRIVGFLKMVLPFILGSIFISIIVIGIVSLQLFEKPSKETDLTIPFLMLITLGRGLPLLDSTGLALLRVFDLFRFTSIIRIILSITEVLIIGLAAFLSGGELRTVLVAMVVYSLLGTMVRQGSVIWMLWDQLRDYVSAPIGVIRDQKREIIRFIISNSLSRSLKIIHTRADVIILGSLAGPTTVGLYSVAKRLASIVPMLTDPLSIAIYPQISSLTSQGDNLRLRNLLCNTSATLSMLCGIFVLFALVLGDFVVVKLYGSNYVDAGLPLKILVFGTSVSTMFFWVVPLIQALGMAVYRLKVDIINVSASLLIAFLLVPKLGATGSAIALTFAYLFGHGVFLAATLNAWPRGSNKPYCLSVDDISTSVKQSESRIHQTKCVGSSGL